MKTEFFEIKVRLYGQWKIFDGTEYEKDEAARELDRLKKECPEFKFKLSKTRVAETQRLCIC